MPIYIFACDCGYCFILLFILIVLSVGMFLGVWEQYLVTFFMF